MFPGTTDWESVVLRLIEGLCRTWGGASGAMFPLIDGTVNEAFWPLLRAHDPDELAVYQLTARHLLLSDPPAFDAWLETQAQNWASQTSMSIDEARTALRQESSLDDRWGPWPPPDDVEKLVTGWLSIRNES